LLCRPDEPETTVRDVAIWKAVVKHIESFQKLKQNRADFEAKEQKIILKKVQSELSYMAELYGGGWPAIDPKYFVDDFAVRIVASTRCFVFFVLFCVIFLSLIFSRFICVQSFSKDLEGRKIRWEITKEKKKAKKKGKKKKKEKKEEKEEEAEEEEEQIEWDDGFDPDEYWKSMTIDQTKIVEKAKTATELAEERRLEYERDKEVRGG
jgi:hypothetical protein